MSAINVIPRTLGLLAAFALAAASARGDDPPARPSFDPEEVFNQADTDGDGKMSKQEFQFVTANAPGCGTTRNGRTGCSGCSTPTGTGRSRPPSSGVWPRCAAAAHRAGPRAAARRRRRPPRRSPTGRRPRIRSRSSRRRSARSSSSSATSATRPRRRRSRAACCSTPGKGRRGGDSGPAVVPGEPEESLLIQAVRHDGRDLKMPPKQQLPDEVVADFEQWVRIGAADPRRRQGRRPQRRSTSRRAGSSGRSSRPKAVARPDGEGRRLAAVGRRPVPPGGAGGQGAAAGRRRRPAHAAPPASLRPDRPAADAGGGRRVPGRRRRPDAFEKVVDRLLASPRFGERWGRHWLDVARYAESSGTTVNFTYPHAWRYRDYVIARSTPTSRTTGSSASRSPATCCRPRTTGSGPSG